MEISRWKLYQSSLGNSHRSSKSECVRDTVAQLCNMLHTAEEDTEDSCVQEIKTTVIQFYGENEQENS